MKVARIPRDQAADKIKALETQKTVWLDFNQRLGTLRQGAQDLYNFKNPFNARIAKSSDEEILTATATREALEQTRTVLVKRAAAADRFISSELPKDYKVAAGTTPSRSETRESISNSEGAASRISPTPLRGREATSCARRSSPEDRYQVPGHRVAEDRRNEPPRLRRRRGQARAGRRTRRARLHVEAGARSREGRQVGQSHGLHGGPRDRRRAVADGGRRGQARAEPAIQDRGYGTRDRVSDDATPERAGPFASAGPESRRGRLGHLRRHHRDRRAFRLGPARLGPSSRPPPCRGPVDGERHRARRKLPGLSPTSRTGMERRSSASSWTPTAARSRPSASA